MPDLPQLTTAFLGDGYDVVGSKTLSSGRLGVTAEHRTALVNNGPPKKAYYVEGTHREMGYLLGFMAEKDVSRMTTDFLNNMLWALAFWHPRSAQDPPDPAEQTIISLIKSRIGDILNDMAARFSQVMERDIPGEYLEEMEGILEGCRAANSQTRVDKKDLLILNFGIDWFLANIYTGFGAYPDLRAAIMSLLPGGINPPGMCNGFSVFGPAAGGGHYFGRDFMFPTAGVFEKTACLIVYNPITAGTTARFPFVSMTAPGFLGTVAGMNRNGVAIGIEIAPSAACDPERPGLNSLLMNRHCIETGGSAEAAKDVIVKAQRGVSWIYIISARSKDFGVIEDKACVVEAVYSTKDRASPLVGPDGDILFTKFPAKKLVKGCLSHRPYLPGDGFLGNHPTARQENGAMVRWADYAYDAAYLDFDPRLFRRGHKRLYPDALGEKGFINLDFTEKNCPRMYYFAPQREARTDVVLTTNHFVIPEMRYTAMSPWLAFLFGKLVQDSQWRYDALNEMILGAIEDDPNGIDSDKAKEILDLLNPVSGRYRGYYGSGKSAIDGSQSLFDLDNLTVESHYGYYADEWVKLSLKNYVP